MERRPAAPVRRRLAQLRARHKPLKEDHRVAPVDVEFDAAPVDPVVAEEREGSRVAEEELAEHVARVRPDLARQHAGVASARRHRRARDERHAVPIGRREDRRRVTGAQRPQRVHAEVQRGVVVDRRWAHRCRAPALQRRELHEAVDDVELVGRRRRAAHARELQVELLFRELAVLHQLEKPAVRWRRRAARRREDVVGPVVRRPRLLHRRAAPVAQEVLEHRVAREVQAQVQRQLRQVELRVPPPVRGPSGGPPARGGGRGAPPGLSGRCGGRASDREGPDSD